MREKTYHDLTYDKYFMCTINFFKIGIFKYGVCHRFKPDWQLQTFKIIQQRRK